MSSRTLWASVVMRVAWMSGALRTLRPTGLTTHAALADTPDGGRSVTVTRPPDAVRPLAGGLTRHAAPSVSPTAPRTVNRIIGVTLPLEGRKTTLGRHPSRRSRHPSAV